MSEELDATLPDEPDNARRDDISPEEVSGLTYMEDAPTSEDDDDVPFRLPPNQEPAPVSPPRLSSHDMPTMPIPREPGTPDPKQTLPGSGGLDPNPDFDTARNYVPRVGDYTAPHEVAQYTQQADYRQYQRPAAQYVPPMPPQAIPQQPANKLPRRRLRRKSFLGIPMGCVMVIAGTLITFCGGLTLITLVLSATLGAQLEERLQQQVAQLDDYQQFQSTFLYDRHGTLLYEVFGEGRRTRVDLEDMPQDLINATIAIEDDTFFTNPGIDVPATTRAFLQYVGLMQGESGGSTITQQIVRNVLFDIEYRSERSIQRKVEEILLALLLNQRKSKEEILEMYLNEIYYGNLAYGAEAAAQTFFSKSVGELTLGEAALLAGLPQAPADLNPLDPDPAIAAAVDARWHQVLDRMVRLGYISEAQRDEALRNGLTLTPPEVPLRAPHFTVYAQQELERLMLDLNFTPDQIASGGLKVYTTVDLRINDMAQAIAQEQVSRLTANNVTNAAIIVLQPTTAQILAMVGSVDYYNDAIDGRVNVTTSLRQPGSTMKPFTYSAFIERGGTPGYVIWDTPTTIGIPGQPGYTPVNYDRTFHGPMRMRFALANSINVAAVQTLRITGVDYLLSLMNRFGVETLGTDASLYGLSLTLGGGEVSLIELTNAYGVFARDGVLVEPTSILCILDSEDNIVYQYENSCLRGNQTGATINRNGLGTQVLDPRISFLMTDILGDNGARSALMGSNSPLRTEGVLSSVKTGTTNDFKDNWTVGYTRNVAVGVWVGNSNGDPMINTSGLAGAAPIWNGVITGIYRDPNLLSVFAVDGQLLNDQISPPGGMSLRQMCDVRTLRDPAMGCNSTINEWFLASPAAIPDGAGNLIPQPPQPPPGYQQPASGPFLREVEQGIYLVLVQPLPPEIGNAITFNITPGQPQPPPPIYCQVPVEIADQAVAAGAREQYFIAPPPEPADAAQAETYARNNGLAFLPTIACSPELLVPGGFGPAVITAVITQPASGQTLTGETPIIGTVQFAPEQALFYKVELIGGQFFDWTTVGSTHNNSVINGQLESLFVPGLQPGNYRIRLAVVGHDGNFVQAPYEVPFTVP